MKEIILHLLDINLDISIHRRHLVARHANRDDKKSVSVMNSISPEFFPPPWPVPPKNQLIRLRAALFFPLSLSFIFSAYRLSPRGLLRATRCFIANIISYVFFFFPRPESDRAATRLHYGKKGGSFFTLSFFYDYFDRKLSIAVLFSSAEPDSRNNFVC